VHVSVFDVLHPTPIFNERVSRRRGGQNLDDIPELVERGTLQHDRTYRGVDGLSREKSRGLVHVSFTTGQFL